jgi:hypothetical protein
MVSVGFPWPNWFLNFKFGGFGFASQFRLDASMPVNIIKMSLFENCSHARGSHMVHVHKQLLFYKDHLILGCSRAESVDIKHDS